MDICHQIARGLCCMGVLCMEKFGNPCSWVSNKHKVNISPVHVLITCDQWWCLLLKCKVSVGQCSEEEAPTETQTQDGRTFNERLSWSSGVIIIQRLDIAKNNMIRLCGLPTWYFDCLFNQYICLTGKLCTNKYNINTFFKKAPQKKRKKKKKGQGSSRLWCLRVHVHVPGSGHGPSTAPHSSVREAVVQTMHNASAPSTRVTYDRQGSVFSD